MLLKHFFTPKVAHSSYILAGSGRCAVIDPVRDMSIYLKAADLAASSSTAWAG